MYTRPPSCKDQKDLLIWKIRVVARMREREAEAYPGDIRHASCAKTMRETIVAVKALPTNHRLFRQLGLTEHGGTVDAANYVLSEAGFRSVCSAWDVIDQLIEATDVRLAYRQRTS